MATINITNSTNLTSVSYAAGDNIVIKNNATLTIDSTPTIKPGSISCTTIGKLLISNKTTNPIVLTLSKMTDDLIFTGNGIFETDGDMLLLATSTGSQMSWDFSTLYSGVLTDITYIEVETFAGSNDFVPWPIIEIDPRYYYAGLNAGGGTKALIAGSDIVSEVFFYNSSTRILETGDNTNGSIISSGRKIRIPNILITNDVALDATLIHQIASKGVPTGGTFTITVINRASNTTLGTTTALAYNAAATTVQTALTTILGASNCTVTGGALPTALVVTLSGTYAATPLALVITSNVTGGTQSIIYSMENAASNLSLINITPSGTLNLKYSAFSRKFNCSNSAFSAVSALNCGFGGGFLFLGSSNGSITLQNMSIVISPYCLEGASGFQYINAYINSITISSKNIDATVYLIGLKNLLNINRLKIYKYGTKTSATSSLLYISTIPKNTKITNLCLVGNRALLYNLTDIYIISPRFADNSSATQNTTVLQSQLGLSNAINMVIYDIGLAGVAAPRASIINTDALCSNINIIGGNIDLANNCPGIISPSNASISVINTKTINARVGPIIDQIPTFLASELTAQKVLATYQTSQTAGSGLDVGQYFNFDLVSSTITGITRAFQSVENYICGNFCDPGLTPTTGHISFGPVGKGAGCNLTGTAYTSQLGTVIMPSINDTVELISQYPMHCISSLQGSLPIIYGDIDGALANIHTVIAPGIPTGGTFTITIKNSSDTVLGTTTAIAFNATTTVVSNAIIAITGAGTVSTTGSLSDGYVISFIGSLTSSAMYLSVDGSLLTGGSEPGIAYAYGRLRQLSIGEAFGSVGLTCQFSIKPYTGTTWSNYTNITTSNLANAISSLTGYSMSDGLSMKLLITATRNNPYNSINVISLLTNLDLNAWSVPDSFINTIGVSVTDTVDIVRYSDDFLITTLAASTSNTKYFFTGAYFDTDVYFIRKNSAGRTLMTTYPTTQKLLYGDNGNVNLFYGSSVQVAANTIENITPAVVAGLVQQGYTESKAKLLSLIPATL